MPSLGADPENGCAVERLILTRKRRGHWVPGIGSLRNGRSTSALSLGEVYRLIIYKRSRGENYRANGDRVEIQSVDLIAGRYRETGTRWAPLGPVGSRDRGWAEPREHRRLSPGPVLDFRRADRGPRSNLADPGAPPPSSPRVESFSPSRALLLFNLSLGSSPPSSSLVIHSSTSSRSQGRRGALFDRRRYTSTGLIASTTDPVNPIPWPIRSDKETGKPVDKGIRAAGEADRLKNRPIDLSGMSRWKRRRSGRGRGAY